MHGVVPHPLFSAVPRRSLFTEDHPDARRQDGRNGEHAKHNDPERQTGHVAVTKAPRNAVCGLFNFAPFLPLKAGQKWLDARRPTDRGARRIETYVERRGARATPQMAVFDPAFQSFFETLTMILLQHSSFLIKNASGFSMILYWPLASMMRSSWVRPSVLLMIMKRPRGTPPSLSNAMSLPPNIVYFVCFVYFGRNSV